MMPRRRIAFASLALGTALAGAILVAAPQTQASANQAEVDMADRSDDIRAEFEEQLNEAVREGKITTEQRDTLLAKHDEIQKKLEAIQKLPETERRKAMEDLNEDTRQWLKDQGLDTLFLRHQGREVREHHGFTSHLE